MKVSLPKNKIVKNKDKIALIAVSKGNPEIAGVEYRVSKMRILYNVASKIYNVPFHEGKSFFMMILPNKDGNLSWINDNVMRFIDTDGVFGVDESCKIAERIIRKIKDSGKNPKDVVGIDLIFKYADHMLMDYDICDMNYLEVKDEDEENK